MEKWKWLFVNGWQSKRPTSGAREFWTRAKTVRMHPCGRVKKGGGNELHSTLWRPLNLHDPGKLTYWRPSAHCLTTPFLLLRHRSSAQTSCIPGNSDLAKQTVNNLPSSSNTLQLKLVRLECDSPLPQLQTDKIEFSSDSSSFASPRLSLLGGCESLLVAAAAAATAPSRSNKHLITFTLRH